MAAGRNISLGFIITAADKASKTFSSVSSRIASTLRAVGFSTISLNQGLSLLRKGWRAVDMVIGETVKTALKFRTDGAAEQFKAFGRSVELVRARLGDAMIPVLQAFTSVLKPVADGMAKWLAENNKMLASRFGEWAVGLARTFANVLVPAIGYVGAAFFGMKAVVQGVKTAIDITIGGIAENLARFIFKAAQGLAALGSTETANKLYATAGALAAVGARAYESSLEGITGIEATLLAYDRWDAGVQTIRTSINNAATAAQLAMGRFNQGITGGTSTIEEQTAACKRLELAIKGITKGTQSYMDMSAAIADAFAPDAPSTVAMEAAIARAETLGSAFGSSFATFVSGERNASEAARSFGATFLGVISQMVSAQITAMAVKRSIAVADVTTNAAVGASEAAKSQAGIPVIGPALAVAASAAIFGLIIAMLTKFHTGGWIPGGKGQERPFMGLGGEYVMSPDEVAAGRPKWARGGEGGGGTTINIHSRHKLNRSALDRELRNETVPGTRRLTYRRYVPVGA